MLQQTAEGMDVGIKSDSNGSNNLPENTVIRSSGATSGQSMVLDANASYGNGQFPQINGASGGEAATNGGTSSGDQP